MPYSRKAVEKAIQASNRSGRPIGAREAKTIHRLLMGRTRPSWEEYEREPFPEAEDSADD